MAQESSNQTMPEEAVNNTEGSTATPTDTQAASEAKFSQSDLDRFASRIRSEEKKKFEKQLSDAQLSENEKLKSDYKQLELKLRMRDAQEALITAARQAGSDDAETVAGWIKGQLDLEFSDDGRVSNLKDLIAQAKELIPARFPKRPGSANGGEGKSSSIGETFNDMIRRASGRVP